MILGMPAAAPVEDGLDFDLLGGGGAEVEEFGATVEPDPVFEEEVEVATPDAGSLQPSHSLGLSGVGSELPSATDPSFRPGRWPGLEAAFAYANREGGGGLLHSMDQNLTDLGSAERAIAALTDQGFGADLKALKARLASFRTAAKNRDAHPDDRKMQEALDRAEELVREEARRVVEAVSERSNPTIQGRTWLLDWQVPADAGSRIELRTEAALVVAPAGVILQPGLKVMLIQAADITSEDRDVMVHEIERQPLLISEKQRRHWGMGMALKQRVFYVYAPDLDNQGPKKRGRKPKD